jgi:4'-phosphopantetheinyl transferase
VVRVVDRSTADGVEIWRADASEVSLERAAALLPADEVAQFDRCRPEVRRVRGVTRALVRMVLGEHLGRPPRSLRFGVGEHGKLALAEPDGGWRFSVAHSGDRGAVAVTHRRDVGVDLEAVPGALPDLEAVARHRLAPEEAASILDRPEPERLMAFLRCWTRKEAFLKATGAGFTAPLDGFAVSVDEAPLLLRREDALRWELDDVDVGPGYVGAVVVATGSGR